MMEKKGLRVNAGKTKVMICGTGLDLLQSSGEYPCTVCCSGVGNNKIYCNGCKLWVSKKCSGLQGPTPNPDYRCAQCMGNARSIDGRPQSEVHVGPDKLEVVASLCFLGDMLSAGGGCEITVTTRVITTWKKPGSYYQFSHPTTSLTRPMAMFTALACGAPCSEPSCRSWPLTKTNLEETDRERLP